MPDALSARIDQVSTRALQSGALQPTATSTHRFRQSGIEWVVQVLQQFSHKAKAMQQQREKSAQSGAYHNPFLPVERELWVADLSSTHHLVLNKFSVIPGHSLILTKAFAEQMSPLNVADFAAAQTLLAQTNGLVFFNGGRDAGASQRHKHLQFVRFPLEQGGTGEWPLAEALSALPAEARQLPLFPFAHWLCPLPPATEAQSLCARYGQGMQALGLASAEACAGSECLRAAYNLLLTRSHLILVPRHQGRYQRLPINALGFAGTLLAKREEDLERYRQVGVLKILRAVVEPVAQSS